MRRHQQYVMVPEAFKVLPPLSPELPAPPRAPQPHRVAAPVPRREKSAFVILNDERPPPSPTGAPPPSGRISPFRGKGFKEESSIRYSREPSPSPPEKRKVPPRSRSRSRLPVATPRPRNVTSASSSPVRGSASGIPRGINRRNSLSPNRATQVLNQVNQNRSLMSPSHQAITARPGVQSPRHIAKPVMSPKRVGPLNSKGNSNSSSTKPPLPKQNQGTQKENDRNLTSPYRRRTQPIKIDVTVTRSPSRIPRTRSVSRTRANNVRSPSPSTSPVRAVVRKSPRVITKPPNTNTNAEKKYGTNGIRRTTPNVVKRNGDKNGVNGERKNGTYIVKNGTPTSKTSPTPKKDVPMKIPEPVEAIVSTVNMVDAISPDSEKMEAREPMVDISFPPQTVESPSPIMTGSVNEEKKEPVEERSEAKKPPSEPVKAPNEDVPEPTVTLVRTTTAPALELAQPDLIPTILSKGEQEISKSISEGPSMEDKSENPGDSRIDALASVESVRSTSSVETVRAVTKAKEAGENEVEVLSANNLMKVDENGRNIAWDNKSSDMSPMNNSVHPLDPGHTSQPSKKKGCCGRLSDKLSCKSCRGPSGKLCSCLKTPASCSKLGTHIRALCGKLNCCRGSNCSKMCSCCKKKDDPPTAAPQRSRVRDCLSRLNCFRWSKCCKKKPQTQEVDLEEGPTGCYPGCKNRCRTCYGALFCLNLACCARLRGCCRCDRLSCCGPGGCCGPNPPQLDRRKSRMSVRKSQTSLVQGIPKLDPTLVEHQSMMRGAVPVLPLPLAWFCCILNVFLPGTGTLLSGVFCMCFGKPRFSINDSYPSRLTALCINIIVAVSQLFTVIFCLVGWGWSIWWGVMMVKFARKQKRILLAEKQAAADQPAPVAVNQNHDAERAH